jgi:hypothetical protein
MAYQLSFYLKPTVKDIRELSADERVAYCDRILSLYFAVDPSQENIKSSFIEGPLTIAFEVRNNWDRETLLRLQADLEKPPGAGELLPHRQYPITLLKKRIETLLAR